MNRIEKAKERFYKKVAELGYTLRGEYQKSNIPVLLECSKGHLFAITPNKLLMGRKCAKCSKQSVEGAYEDLLEVLQESGCEIKGEYVGSNTPILFRCEKGHLFLKSPSKLRLRYKRNGDVGCPECSGKSLTKSKRDFLALAEQENYEVLSEYVRNHDPVSMRCPNGHYCEISPNNFKRGRRCPKCRQQGLDNTSHPKIKKSQKDISALAEQKFRKIVKERNFKITSDWKNTTTLIDMLCPQKHSFSMRPYDFTQGANCPICEGKNAVFVEKRFLEAIILEGYTLKSDYKGSNKKVTLECGKGHSYETTPYAFVNEGVRCTWCTGRNPLYTKTLFLEKLKESGYVLLGEFATGYEKTKVRCNKGHEYSVEPSRFIHGARCKECRGLTASASKERLFNIFRPKGITLVSEYINSSTPIRLRCSLGHEYTMFPCNVNEKHECKVCVGNTPEQAKARFEEAVRTANYTSSPYIGAREKCLFKCPNPAHTPYWGAPCDFMSGYRCYQCFPGGYSSDRKGFFYIIKLKDTEKDTTFYKIGISNVPEKRHASLMRNWEESPLKIVRIYLYEHEDGKVARNLETLFKKTFKDKGLKELYLDLAGCTEMFEFTDDDLEIIAEVCENTMQLIV